MVDLIDKGTRRRVSQLRAINSKYYVISIMFFYVCISYFVWPFVTAGQLQMTSLANQLSVSICTLIMVILPLFTFARASIILRAVLKAGVEAERIDNYTQEILDGAEIPKKRSELQEKYMNMPTQYFPVKNVLMDAVRRAYSDRWEPPRKLLEGVTNQIANGLPSLAAMQRIALQLGIVGTFLGLMLAFQEEGFARGAELNAIQMGGMIEALKLAFGTSIAGLMVSIPLILIYNSLKSSVSITLDRLELMVDNVFEFAKRLEADYDSDLAQVRRAINSIKKDVEGVSNGYINVVEHIDKAGASLLHGRETFDIRITEFVENQKRVLEQTSHFFNKISPDNLSKSLHSAVITSGMKMAKDIQSYNDTVKMLRDIVIELTESQNSRFRSIDEIASNYSSIKKQISAIEVKVGLSPEAGGKKRFLMIKKFFHIN